MAIVNGDKTYVARFHATNYPLIYHWGILIEKPDGNDVIYHSTSDTLNEFGGAVKKQYYSDFKKQGYYLFDKTPIPLTEQQVAERTKPYLRQKWDLALFNCRDYVQKIWSRIPEGQEKYVKWAIGGAIGLIITGIILGRVFYNKRKNK